MNATSNGQRAIFLKYLLIVVVSQKKARNFALSGLYLKEGLGGDSCIKTCPAHLTFGL